MLPYRALVLAALAASLLRPPAATGQPPPAEQEEAGPLLGGPADDEAEQPQAPVETDDAALAQALTRRLSRMKELENVRVTVDAGVVRLTGEARSAKARREAEALVRRTEDVAEVENELVIAGGLAEQVGALGRTWERLRVFLPVVAFAGAVFLVFVLLAWLAGRCSFPFRWLGLNPFLVELARCASRGLVLLIGAVVALQILDATALVGAVVGTAGLVGLALGFAFRDVAENYVASVLLSLRQPFVANDFVRIGENEGRVLRLTSRATILLTLDGNHVRIPNAQVFKGVIVNFTRNPKRRFDFVVSVSTEGDLVRAQQAGLQALRAVPGVLHDPEPWAHVEGLGESSVPIRFYAWIDQREVSWFKSRGEAIRLVKEAMEAEGLELPEPIYRVRLQEHTAEERRSPTPRPEPQPAEALVDRRDPIVDEMESERRTRREQDLLDPEAPRE